MNFNHDQFASISNEHLKPLAGASQAQGTPAPSQSAGAATSLGDELHNAGKHTETGQGNASGSSGASGAADAPKSAKKTLSQLTGGNGGRFAINIMDVVLPALICFLVNRLGYKLEKEAFKLTKDERELLEPCMQELLDSIYVDLNNPVAQFALVFAMIYGSKVLDAIPQAEKLEPKEARVVQHDPEAWKTEFAKEYSKLIDARRAKSHCSADKAKELLKKSGEEDALRERIQRKYQKQAA